MITLILAAVLLSASDPSPALRVSDRPVEPDEVPPGTREDQVLYASLRNGTAELRARVTTAGQVLFEAQLARYNLDLLAKEAPPDDARRLEEIRARLEPLHRAAYEAVPRGGVLGCRYTVMHLEDSMIAAPGTAPARRLPEKRAEARRCDEGVRAALARLDGALGALRTAVEEVAPELRAMRVARGIPDRPPPSPPSAGAAAPAAAEPPGSGIDGGRAP